MPKMTDRERLARLESDQRRLAEETRTVRSSLRAQYGLLTETLEVEALSEREFREVLSHAIRVGGGVAIGALKALHPEHSPAETSPGRRPGDEHGAAARRRPTPVQGAASPGDGPGH
jgi:hypothetical protein